MHAARWRPPVIAAALVLGTSGALVTSITGAGATGHPAHAAGPGPVAFAASAPAPFVSDAVGARRSKRGMGAPPTSRAMRRANAARQAAARRYLRRRRPRARRILAATQQPQVRDYFCGPATVSEMLAQMGVRLGQFAAARQLGTRASGTDWSNSHGYPVARVLNANQRRNGYVAVGLPWFPTRRQVGVYERDLVADISRRGGVPIAGNGYEVPGGPHLVGHPAGLTIMHWFDIRGYARSGKITYYEDSVHGAASIGWGAGVPAYSALPSVTIVYILGARGYVW